MQDCPIKVGFVVQMPEVWNKQAPVYEEMVRDPRFDPWLIVVPSYNLTTRRREGYGAELAYFRKSYPDGQILTNVDLGEDFSGMPSCGFHYVFISRCWEANVPDALRTRHIIQYAKTCYIPYVFHCFNEHSSYYNTRFFNSLYLMFCSSDDQKTIYTPKDRRKSLSLGYPGLSPITYSPPRAEKKMILWTPRWEKSLEYGGTSFFDYRNLFIPLKERNPEYQIVMRPHPLTFEHAIQNGSMTENEATEYVAKQKAHGILFDENKSIDSTLPEVDVLLTDFSSVIVDALLFGKPIIYCGKKTNAQPNSTLLEILDAVYIARNWDDVVRYLEMLFRNEDPLLSKREQLAKRMVEKNKNSCKAILDYLIFDASRQKELRNPS